MRDKIIALEENDTYELPSVAYGKKVIGGRWVYPVRLGLVV